jgi:hypothetical protein
VGAVPEAGAWVGSFIGGAKRSTSPAPEDLLREASPPSLAYSFARIPANTPIAGCRKPTGF